MIFSDLLDVMDIGNLALSKDGLKKIKREQCGFYSITDNSIEPLLLTNDLFDMDWVIAVDISEAMKVLNNGKWVTYLDIESGREISYLKNEKSLLHEGGFLREEYGEVKEVNNIILTPEKLSGYWITETRFESDKTYKSDEDNDNIEEDFFE